MKRIEIVALKMAGLGCYKTDVCRKIVSIYGKGIRSYNQIYATQFQEESVQLVLRESSKLLGRNGRQI